MKKITKTMLLVIFACSMLFNTAYAKEESSLEAFTFKSQTVSNEYEFYKTLKNKSNDDLNRLGYSKEQVKYIEEFSYEEEFAKKVEVLKSLNKSDLSELGYNQQQIDIIDNYTGTPTQMAALSATLTLTTAVGSYGKSSTFSHINFRTNFNWSSHPVFRLTDILAVPWSEGMYLDQNSSLTKSIVSYYEITSSSPAYTENPVITPNLNKGAYFKIKVDKTVDHDIFYSKTGSFLYRLTKASEVTEVAVQPTYGHTTIAIGSPSVSFPTGVSVSFSVQTSEADHNYVHQVIK